MATSEFRFRGRISFLFGNCAVLLAHVMISTRRLKKEKIQKMEVGCAGADGREPDNRPFCVDELGRLPIRPLRGRELHARTGWLASWPASSLASHPVVTSALFSFLYSRSFVLGLCKHPCKAFCASLIRLAACEDNKLRYQRKVGFALVLHSES